MGMPDYNAVNMGDRATPITHDLAVNARNETNDQVYGSLMGGTERAKGLLPSSNLDTSLGRVNPMTAAIAQRTNRATSLEDAKLKFEMGQKAKDLHFEKLMRAEQAVGQEQNMNYQKALAKWKQKQAAKAARAGLIGAVLGTGGAIAGAAIGGAPGAVIGQAGGSLVGSAAGGAFDGV